MTVSRIRDVAVVAWAVIACHNARTDPPHSAADSVGIYQFSEQVSATGAGAESIELVGHVVVLADTVTVEARPGPCRPDVNVKSPNPFTYNCGPNVVLTFDRRDPTLRALYTAMVAEDVTRRVCTRYTTDSSGRRICAESRSETSQRMVRQSGTLKLTRVPESDAPKVPTS